MPPELRRIWFIWISWISWVCMQLSSLSHLVTESERLLIQTLTQNVITHHEEKKWYWISVIFLIVPISAFFVFFGSAQWYDFTAHCQKEKKTRLTCVTFGILCFNGFALCPVFLRDNTTVSHVCATDLKISQLWVLLALRFIIYWVMQYVTVIPVYKARYWDKDPPSPPHSIYFADGREGQENFGSCVSSSLISQCDNPGYFNYVYLSNTDYKGYGIERNVTWKMFIP